MITINEPLTSYEAEEMRKIFSDYFHKDYIVHVNSKGFVIFE